MAPKCNWKQEEAGVTSGQIRKKAKTLPLSHHRGTTAKKCTEKRDARGKLLFFFANTNLLLFVEYLSCVYSFEKSFRP